MWTDLKLWWRRLWTRRRVRNAWKTVAFPLTAPFICNHSHGPQQLWCPNGWRRSAAARGTS